MDNTSSKLQKVEDFLNKHLPDHRIKRSRDDKRDGYCFRIKGDSVACSLYFSDEFLDDRMGRNFDQFLFEDGDTIIDMLKSGKNEILVMNQGIGFG